MKRVRINIGGNAEEKPDALGLRRTRSLPGPARDAGRIRWGGEGAFTMVEIALCLAIVAFALVAIMGVLPSGLKVQKENREETLLNHDGMYLLEAIRSGSKGLDDLTNYVEAITVHSQQGGSNRSNTAIYTNSVNPGPYQRLVNGYQIVGLLSLPKIEHLPNGTVWTNQVVARMRPISGSVGEKGKLNQEFAFRYEVRPEIVPYAKFPLNMDWADGQTLLVSTNLAQNLYDVRLTVRWPLFQHGTTWRTGNGRMNFRTLVSGELRRTNNIVAGNPLFFFEPYTFTSSY
jgi:type II secretory pathway pseudopilin PulG